jgi:hypothetical protein
MARGRLGLSQRGGRFLPPAAGEEAGGLLQAGVASQVRVGEFVGRDLLPQAGVGRAGDAARESAHRDLSTL